VAVPWDVVASTAGGAIATILGVLVGSFVGHRTQERHWLRDKKAEVYANFLREYTRVEWDLRRAYLQEQAPQVDWAPWGAASTTISLVADAKVVTAAARIVEQFLRIEAFVRHGKRQDAEWQRLTAQLVEAQLGFVNAARRELDRSQPALQERIGGPPLNPLESYLTRAW
jgi:hypothetical protein